MSFKYDSSLILTKMSHLHLYFNFQYSNDSNLWNLALQVEYYVTHNFEQNDQITISIFNIFQFWHLRENMIYKQNLIECGDYSGVMPYRDTVFVKNLAISDRLG